MLAKNKALELYSYYFRLYNSSEKAILASLKVRDEIFEFMRQDDEDCETAYWANHKTSSFWCEVQSELIKIRESHR